MCTLSGQLSDPCEDRLTKIPTVLPYRCNPSSETKKPLEKKIILVRVNSLTRASLLIVRGTSWFL